MRHMGGHKTRHSEEIATSEIAEVAMETAEDSRDKWWAVRDSNPRHPACKAGALTN